MNGGNCKLKTISYYRVQDTYIFCYEHQITGFLLSHSWVIFANAYINVSGKCFQYTHLWRKSRNRFQICTNKVIRGYVKWSKNS